MVGKGTGADQSYPKHLNYKTASTECTKTAGKSCNKYTNTEAMVTMKFIGEPEQASSWREELTVGNKNAHHGEFLMAFYRHSGLDLTAARIYFLGISFAWLVEISGYRWIHSTPGCPDTAASQEGWSER